jgi:hypothetical protein
VDSGVRRGNSLGRLVRPMRKLAPYIAVALIVPGGSLVALALWAFRRPVDFANRPASGAIPVAITRATLKALILFTPLLASCASSGLYNMSDQWCAGHAQASTAQCPRSQQPDARTASRE